MVKSDKQSSLWCQNKNRSLPNGIPDQLSLAHGQVIETSVSTDN